MPTAGCKSLIRWPREQRRCDPEDSGRILGSFDADASDLDDLLAAARAERDRADAENLATMRRVGAL